MLKVYPHLSLKSLETPCPRRKDPVETRSQIQGLEMPKLHAHTRQWGSYCSPLRGKGTLRWPKLCYLRTPGTMRVSVAILQCLIDTASSISLKSAPLSLNTWSSSTVKSHPTSTGTNLLLPHGTQASTNYPLIQGHLVPLSFCLFLLTLESSPFSLQRSCFH